MNRQMSNGHKVADPFRLTVGDPFRITGPSLSPQRRRASINNINNGNQPLSPGLSPSASPQRRRNSVSYTALAAAAMTENPSFGNSPSELSPPRPISGLDRRNKFNSAEGRPPAIVSMGRQLSCGDPLSPTVAWNVPIGSPMNFVKEKACTRGLQRSSSAVDGIARSAAGQTPSPGLSPASPTAKSQVRLPPMPQAAVLNLLPGECKDACVNPANQSWPPSGRGESSPVAGALAEMGETASTASWDGKQVDNQDSEKDSLQESRTEDEAVDLSFLIAEAPSVDEAVERFRTGLLLDHECHRVHKAYRRFCASEDDLNKDCLDLVASHMGYMLVPEEDMEEMANKVSDLSSFDLEELMSFLQAYAGRQKDLLEAAFNKQANLDQTDEGATIPVEKVSLLMKDLCLVVLNGSFQEIIKRAGLEGTAMMDIDQVARVVAAYRSCEGFTVNDLKEAKEKFDEALEDDRLAITGLPNALLDFFGVHCVKHLRDLVEAGGDALIYEGPHTPGVSFHEYLIWARHLRNAELLEVFEFFENACDNDDNVLTREELMDVIKQEGFTLTTAEGDEFLEAAELVDNESFSFDDTVTFLEACREGEGFGQKNREELAAAYKRFDTEEEGEISTIQVLDLLRYLGYQIQVEQVEKYAKEVDFNGNGTMDIDEYMRLMRLHREDELNMMLKVFSNRVGRKVGARLPFEHLHDVLNACKCCSSHCDVFEELLKGAIDTAGQPSLNWDEFRDLADKGRKAVKRAQRKKANFSDDEFATLQDTFAEYDLDGTGVLGTDQLLLLLHRCGVPVHKKSSRRHVVEMLDKAREAALDAEIATEDVGESGSCTATFWSMVHAWRTISRRNEVKNLSRLEESTSVASFTASEVEEFQQIFSMWSTKRNDGEGDEEAVEEAPAERMEQARRRSVPDLYSSAPKEMGKGTRDMLTNVKQEGVKKKAKISLECLLGIDNEIDHLHFHSFKQLLGHLKLKLGPEHVRTLEKEMLILTGNCEGILDFANFLSMMRWMLETNYAHINDLTASAAKNVASAAKSAPKVAPAPRQSEPGPPKLEEQSGNRGSRLLGRRASM